MESVGIRTVNRKIQEGDIVIELTIELTFFIPTTKQIQNENIYKTT
jgi:hypothetical protein